LKQTRFTKALLYILKVGLSAWIMWRIASKIALGTAIKDIFSLPLTLVVLLILLSVLRHVLQYHNWLFALKINPGFKEYPQQVRLSYFVGLPLRFALPGGHASIAKILYVSNSSKIASFWSTALERGFMTWGSWTFACMGAIFYYTQYSLWLWLGLLLLCLLLPLILYLVLGRIKRWAYLQSTYARQAPKMMSLQIAATLVTYLQYWLLINRFLPVSALNSSIRMALTQFSNTIPITIAGLGLRESFAIHFLGTLGISAEQAVSVTLSLFIFQDLLPALIGSGFLLVGKKA
jgi:hypothetical protein